MSERIPVLFDTDIGRDTDDAVALAYLLRQPRCELLGITTVSGETGQRAACAVAVRDAAGRRDVPIFAGVGPVVVEGPGQAHVPQYQAIASRYASLPGSALAAMDFMRATIRSRPGEVVLLSVGPLTNVALLFALDPELPRLLKSHVLMAGDFLRPDRIAEWNCKCDPVATAMAWAAPVPKRVAVGLDVTTKCVQTPDEVRARYLRPPLDTVLSMAEVWFSHAKRMTYHDPLAAALIFEPTLCGYQSGTVKVDYGPGAEGGRTHFTPAKVGDKNLTDICATVRPEAFFTEYFRHFEA